MKLTQKLLALVMALAMVFSFAACAKDAPAAPETTKPAETTEAPTDAAPVDGPEFADCTGKFEFGEFAFKVNGKEIKNADLKDTTMWKVKDLETVNSKGNASSATYSGYKLADVLKAAGVEKATKVILTCNDGYEVTYELTDANIDFCLVALEKDKEMAEEGFFFAPCLEETSQSFAKNVVEITAE